MIFVIEKSQKKKKKTQTVADFHHGDAWCCWPVLELPRLQLPVSWCSGCGALVTDSRSGPGDTSV